MLDERTAPRGGGVTTPVARLLGRLGPVRDAGSDGAGEGSGESVEVRDLQADDALREIYEKVLEPAFPPDEIETFDVFRAAVMLGESDEGAFGLAVHDDVEGPLGCMVFYPFPASRVLLLGYIATRADRRSTGVGSLLYESARRRWFGDGAYDLVVAEVDDPRFFAEADGISPQRRIEFYSRVGGELIAGPYIQPRVREGADRVPDMLLVVLHAAGPAVVPPGRSVRSSAVLAFLEEYFRGEAPGSDVDDREVDWLCGWYRQRETVELLPVGEYCSVELPRSPTRGR